MSIAIPARFLDRATPPHLVTLVLLAGLSAMSMSVFLPSLPAMAAWFGTDYAVMQLSVSLYLATNAVLQLMIGPISDRYGRRPVVLGALALFLVATVGCMLAPNIAVFLFFRMLQGAVVVGIVLSRAIVRDMVPQDQAASMIGYVTMGMALVPMIAPVVGGGLDQAFGWHAVFLFLLAFGAFVLWLVWVDQGETAESRSASFASQMADYPELFRSPRFWGYAMAAATASGAFFGFLGGAPYAASVIYGLDPFWTGVGFGAPAIGYILGNFLSGRYSARAGINRMMLIGAAILIVGLGISLIVGALGFSGPVLFFFFCSLVGVGNGMILPNAQAGMLSVRPHLAGTASGLGGALMIGGGAAVSVLAGVLLEGAATSMPLLWLMFVSGIAAMVSVLFVLRRERKLAGR